MAPGKEKKGISTMYRENGGLRCTEVCVHIRCCVSALILKLMLKIKLVSCTCIHAHLSVLR